MSKVPSGWPDNRKRVLHCCTWITAYTWMINLVRGACVHVDTLVDGHQ